MPDEAKSTSDTINRHMQSVPLDRLPKTYKDAIAVAKQLEVRYIWIDALCIIQDSLQDWEQESAVMGEIYSNALFTVAALSAAGVTEGFRLYESRKGAQDGFHHVRPGFPHQEQERIYIYQPLNSQVCHDDDTLASRGWALQERELSRRRLSYSTEGIQWECKSKCQSNELPWGSTVFMHTGQNISNGHHGNSLDFDGIRQSWCDIVIDYSSRLLTKEEDRLPALSGVAWKMHNQMGNDYVAGIWAKHALSDILWTKHYSIKSENQVKRPKAYIAPSWSWASIIGKIYWDPYVSERDRLSAARIHSLQAELAGSDPYGAVLAGVLKISGQVKAAVCKGGDLVKYKARSDNRSTSNRDPFREKGRKLIDPITGRCVAFITHDIDNEGIQPGTVFCLRVLPYLSASWAKVIADPVKRTAAKMGNVRQDVSHGLALVPTGNANGEFRRVGYVKHLLDAWLDDTVDSTITII
ncbi:heterokaryon incompatibility protein-domain-containing protein [Hyaloscypha sp. PMI_1271]|nr:heterokaryon incompatibility protein-domain-containing protein [Hyaloscypha sp. PMI_1271]